MSLTIQQAAKALADATQAQMDYDLEHAGVKHQALLRLITQPNPLGKNGALHSASSAEAVLEQEADYRASRQKKAELTAAVILAQGEYHAAVARELTLFGVTFANAAARVGTTMLIGAAS